MAVYELKNETVAVQINSCGAELRSLKKLDTGVEYMWQADPRFWGRTSPILFPFVGGLKNGTYRIGEKSYSMPKHGFVRDMEFEVISQTENEIWFQLKPTEETLKIYPYEFVLKQGYQLLPDGVKVLWQVENPGKEELYFSIGGHPAFNCPMEGVGKQSDYMLRFMKEGKPLTEIVSVVLEGGLAGEGTLEFGLEDGYLPITPELFDTDTIILEDGQADEVSLCDPEGKEYVQVNFPMPLVGIWTPIKKNAPFLCIEPWCGRCDDVDSTGELSEKRWGNELEPGGVFETAYTVALC